ncbi:MAG: DUF4097 family beta strand repeat-containing protein [Cyclobacteriaceae bacterium]|nr:DUF4097 family beta strand repeat-containing protein [Cyclobacteriaceae bacterium]
MKTNIFLGLIMMFLSGIINAQNKGEINVSLSNPDSKGSLYVNIKRANIKVQGTNRQDVLIQYEPMALAEDCDSCDDDRNKRKSELERISNNAVALEAVEDNNKVRISSDSWNKGFSLIIQVPRNFDLDINGYDGGDILVENVKGEVALQNYNGKISAIGISGSVSANTYNGKIIVTLKEVTLGVPMAFNTYNGDVDVTFPKSMKGSFKLKTSRGSILSAFDMEMRKPEPVEKTKNKSDTYKVYLNDWVKADLNGGGPEIVMKTYNNDIYIRKSNTLEFITR